MTITDTTAAEPGRVPDVAGRDLGPPPYSDALAAAAAAASGPADVRQSGVYNAHQRLDSLASSLATLVKDIETALAPVLRPGISVHGSTVRADADTIPKDSPVAESLSATCDTVGGAIAALQGIRARIDV